MLKTLPLVPALATLRVAYTHPTLGPVYVAPSPTFAWHEVSSATLAAAHGDVLAWKGTATGGEKVRGRWRPHFRSARVRMPAHAAQHEGEGA
jgi:hypothetical protein